MTLPDGPTWVRAVVEGEPDVEEVRWTANDPEGAIGCRVIVTVQNPFPGTLEAYRTYLETTGAETLDGIDADRAAPAKTEGLIARYAGGTGSATPFTSTLRTWLTTGGTKITVSASTSPAMAATCDPASIAASLAWDGTERSAPTPSRPPA
ncbi:MAG: hypothetical protein ACRCSN_07205 [Dermatophilaceae bacterium]